MNSELFEILSRHTNTRGIILASQRALLRESRLLPEELQSRLAQLESVNEIEILSPLPFLVARARMWSGSKVGRAPTRPDFTRVPPGAYVEVPVSSSFAAAALHTEVGGAGEGDRLLRETLATLGPEADPVELRSLLAQVSPMLVRRCLQRVEATQHIRVSKTALFRSLLSRLSR